jgi:GNAT superfamily N-acetyltransferase
MAISPAFTPGSGPEPIRAAEPSEWEMLRQLEVEADRLFDEVGTGPFDMTEADDHFAKAAVVLVAGRPAKGFACVEPIDGLAHLWQQSVHPSAGRQGIGRSLVEAVCVWASSSGYPAVSLTAYRDVPWNAPFYRKLGFRVLEELSPGLEVIRNREKEIGDDDVSPRVAMRKDL